MRQNLSIKSGVDLGILEIKHTNISKMIESSNYERHANQIMHFLEGHLCAGTFFALCDLASRRMEKRGKLFH